MLYFQDLLHNSPNCSPMNFSGKLTYKVVMKKDHVKKDGTCNLYLQVFQNRVKKMLPIHISVTPGDFDAVKQRVKKGNCFANDYNLIIEKMLSDITKIEVSYRLSNQLLTLDKISHEYQNPTAKIDFVKFWENEMVTQKLILKSGTYRQQMSMLNKLKEYKSPLFFYEITPEFLNEIKSYFKKQLKNNDNTIYSWIKSFKKYLHMAHKKGIITPLPFDEIKNREFKSERTFLSPDEIRLLYKYWNSEFINEAHKKIIGKFLFSCFTGLRLSDVQKLSSENILEKYIIFVAEKTTKIQRIPLNKSALEFLDCVLSENFTPEYMNRELKFITKVVGIQKKVSFHVGRHTFATNFLLSGGRVEHLQKLLAHSKITETMIYVHIVESITDEQIQNMDDILN